MPFVRVSMWEGRPKEQKVDPAKRITEAVTAAVGAPAEATTVIFEDVAKEDWVIGGTPASDM